jgi:diguanylate cyclase (GGDEF)-like protein
VWKDKSLLLGYGSAAAAIALATGFRLLLDPGLQSQRPFCTYYLAVVLIAWYAGFGPSIAAMLFGFLAGSYFFGPAPDSFAVFGSVYQVDVGQYLIGGFVTSLLGESLHRERARAGTDYLTGLSNSRSFHKRLRVELKRARQSERPLTLVYLDLDNFKDVNDQVGHHRGDILLRYVAVTIQTCTRKTDLVARVGGDEFALLLPATGPEAAQVFVHKLQRILRASMPKAGFPVTCSIGAVTLACPPSSVDEPLDKADKLMYAAKANGKNGAKFQVIGSRQPETTAIS